MKIFSPNIMEDKNIENLKKKYFRFLTSQKFRKISKIKCIKNNFRGKIKEILKFTKCLKFFNCKIRFCLQPALNWSKEKSKEEQQLIDYSNLFLKKKQLILKNFYIKKL